MWKKSKTNFTLEEIRKELQAVGLWDNENLEDMNFQIPQNTDSSSLNVLNLYIQEAKDKLAVFDSLEKENCFIQKYNK